MQGTGTSVKRLSKQGKEDRAKEGREEESLERERLSGLYPGPDVGDLRRRKRRVLCSGGKSGFLIKRAVSTSSPLSPICIQTMFSGSINKNSLSIPLKIKTEEETIEMHALLDSGAGGKFIDQNYAKTLKLPLKTLDKPIPAINIDGTLKKKRTIKHYINLEFEVFGQPQTI